MTFAAAYEDSPRAWGVGRLVIDGEVTPWPVSQHDIDDEAESHTPRLAALGVGAGDLVLVVAMLSEAIHAVPLEKAAGKLGALYSSADATAPDAFRVAYLTRQLEPAAVVGVNRAVLDGLRELGHDPSKVFSSVAGHVATADDDAYDELTASNLAPRRWVKLGPTSAWEEEPGTVAYDATRWEAVAVDGMVTVTNLTERLTPCRRLATGVPGRVPLAGTVALA
ncbi:MAG TPA: hypothetical protein VMQ81_10965 [Acidimicrobiia bacterium]|nr:hypothetical protein [Acidimicrobiia bacterium]